MNHEFVDSEQNRFDRQFDGIIRANYGEEAVLRYKKALYAQSLQESLVDELEQGEYDVDVVRANLADLNELAGELGQFGHVKITGDVLVRDGDRVLHRELLQPTGATFTKFDVVPLDDSSHMLVYEFEDLLVDSKSLTGYGAVEMIKLLPVIEDASA